MIYCRPCGIQVPDDLWKQHADERHSSATADADDAYVQAGNLLVRGREVLAQVGIDPGNVDLMVNPERSNRVLRIEATPERIGRLFDYIEAQQSQVAT